MSRDPGYCGNCLEEKVRARHLNIPVGEMSGSTSGSLAGKAKVIKDLAHPFEYEDESHCANINCTNGQAAIFDEVHRLNKSLNHAARTGDWTKIDKEDLDRLEQLSEKANEVEDVADIEWLDGNKMEEWEGVRTEIDKFENNSNEVIERTAKVDSDPERRVQGKDRTPESEDILDNLHELRRSIYAQEIVADHINRISGRSNEQEVVVDEETARRENEEDEQQEYDDAELDEVSKEALQEKIKELEEENEDLNTKLDNRDASIENLEEENEDLNAKLDDRDETIENLEEENEELADDKIELINEKQDLMDKIQGLTDDKMELVDEKQELSGDNLDLKEEIQHLRAKVQQLETERESEAEVEDTPERDGTGEDAAGVGAGGRNDPQPSSGASPREGEKDTQNVTNGANIATARANGGVDESGDGGSSTTGSEQHGEATAESEEQRQWKQKWIGQPEPTRGTDSLNDPDEQPTENEHTRADTPDRDQTDDETLGGRT